MTKHILITGASGGIGYNLAKFLAKHDYHIIASGRTISKLEKLYDEITEDGGKCTIIPLDLRDTDLITNLAATIFERFGKLDGFINLAGISPQLTPIAHIDEKYFNNLIQMELKVPFLLLTKLHDLFLHAGGAKIIFSALEFSKNIKHNWGGLAMMKAAQNVMIENYNIENKFQNIKAYMHEIDHESGLAATDFTQATFPGIEDKNKFQNPEEEKFLTSFLKLLD